MKMLLYAAIFTLLVTTASAQNISGKWYGKISQQPGGFSQIQDFELDLVHGDSITGESYEYITRIHDARIGLSGSISGNRIELQEYKERIVREKIPLTWMLCIKKLLLTYCKESDREYLLGDWSGVGKSDGVACMPGSIVLARSKENVEIFLANGGLTNPPLPVILPEMMLPAFSVDFNKTTVRKVREIAVSNTRLKIRLYDYLKTDNDTVSLYLNRNSLAKNVRISKRPLKIDFNLDSGAELNEILLYAENLGKLPPNTSMLEIIDGKQTYRIKIESDKLKTAAIYLRHKSEENTQ